MRRKLIAALIGSALAALIADSLFIEPARLVVNRQELSLPKWPFTLSGLRVALLSDLHVGSPHWGVTRVQRLVTQVNAEHPDLIVLAGDYMINGVKLGTRVPPAQVAEALGGLRAPLGVLAVLGNHDGWHGLRLRPWLQRKGIRVLDDEVFRVTARGTTFCVLGLADQDARERSPSQELALAPPNEPLLVVVHEPDIFPELGDRAALTLAGHTHGGQVRLPFFGPPIVHSRYGQRYAAGHVIENGRHLFVTTGIGTSELPIRLGVPPEFALLTLRSQQ